jgi:hypothetical protein
VKTTQALMAFTWRVNLLFPNEESPLPFCEQKRAFWQKLR